MSKVLSAPAKRVDYNYENVPRLESRKLESGGSKLLIVGPYSRADVPNGNKRRYDTPLWENLLKNPDFLRKFERRLLLGMLGHPKDGELDIEKAAFVTTNLTLPDKDGWIYGESELLISPRTGKLTPSAQVLEVLYDCGVRLGISSRGFGPSYMEDDIEVLDPDEFMLDGYDLVVDPSVSGADPELVQTESRQREGSCDIYKSNLLGLISRVNERLSVVPNTKCEGKSLAGEFAIYRGLLREMKLLNDHSIVCGPSVTESISRQAQKLDERIVSVVESLEAKTYPVVVAGTHQPTQVTESSPCGGSEMSDNAPDTSVGDRLKIVESLQTRVESITRENEDLKRKNEGLAARVKAAGDLQEAANKQLLAMKRENVTLRAATQTMSKKLRQVEKVNSILSRKYGQSEKTLRDLTKRTIDETQKRLTDHVKRLARSFGKSEGQATRILSRARSFKEANELFSDLTKTMRTEDRGSVTPRPRVEGLNRTVSTDPSRRPAPTKVSTATESQKSSARAAATISRRISGTR